MDEKSTFMRMLSLHGGQSVLHNVIKQDQVELAECLLEKGADVNFADDYGKTPLLAAVKSREVDRLIPLLLKHGADVTARDIDGRNILHWLAQPFVYSARLAEHVGTLIAKGASIVDRTSDTYYQPLHEAVNHGNIEMVKVLLEHGADVNDAQTEYGRSPLYIATKMYMSVPLVEILLEYGADVNITAANGQTALHPTCEKAIDHTERKIIRELLLSAGADCCVTDQYGNTAFGLLIQHIPWICLKGITHPNLIPFFKALALKSVNMPASIGQKDEAIIKRYPETWQFYEKCIQIVSKAKSSKIINSCSYLDLLTKCHCQIAPFMRHQHFESQFRAHDLIASFDMYSYDIREAFKRAEDYYHEMLEQEDVINEAVYNSLPDLVVRKVVDNIYHCRMKKCASN